MERQKFLHCKRTVISYVMSRYGGVKCYDMDRVFNSPEEFLKTFSIWSRIELISFIISILRGTKQIHQKGGLVGDINPQNILFRGFDNVAPIDIDSIQVGEWFCPVGHEDYASPQLQGKSFKLQK